MIGKEKVTEILKQLVGGSKMREEIKKKEIDKAYQTWLEQVQKESDAWVHYRHLLLEDIIRKQGLEKGKTILIFKNKRYVFSHLNWASFNRTEPYSFFMNGWKEGSKGCNDSNFTAQIGKPFYNFTIFTILNDIE